MADAKISADSDAGALAGSELIPLIKSGANKTTTPDTLATRVGAALGLNTAATHPASDFDAAGAAAAAAAASVPTSAVDTDGTLAANSDAKIATQKAVKKYVDDNAGGGSSPIQSATVTLTTADLAALPSTAFQLVASQGVGKVIVPISFCAVSAGTVGDQGASSTLGMEWGTAVDFSNPFCQADATLTGLSSSLALNPGYCGGASVDGLNAEAYSIADLANKPISLCVVAGSSDFNGADVTLTVTTLYRVMDVA